MENTIEQITDIAHVNTFLLNDFKAQTVQTVKNLCSELDVKPNEAKINKAWSERCEKATLDAVNAAREKIVSIDGLGTLDKGPDIGPSKEARDKAKAILMKHADSLAYVMVKESQK